jgi:predicted RNase H-like HicB family nuclease
MTVKTIAKVKPAFPFEAYSHVVSPISAADGGGFMFTMPDIPGVIADGTTEPEAIADGREAFISNVSALVDMGQEVPKPAFNAADFTPASASGKVLARLPRSMHLQLTARAKTEGVSLNSLVLAYIAEGLGRRITADRRLGAKNQTRSPQRHEDPQRAKATGLRKHVVG